MTAAFTAPTSPTYEAQALQTLHCTVHAQNAGVQHPDITALLGQTGAHLIVVVLQKSGLGKIAIAMSTVDVVHARD
jgi:hypothetical protein